MSGGRRRGGGVLLAAGGVFEEGLVEVIRGALGVGEVVGGDGEGVLRSWSVGSRIHSEHPDHRA